MSMGALRWFCNFQIYGAAVIEFKVVMTNQFF
jgi:hypothetical protein